MEAPAADASIATMPGLGKFNGYMTSRSYVSGFSPSKQDLTYFKVFPSEPAQGLAPHVYRWFKHIASFPASVQASWPAEGYTPVFTAVHHIPPPQPSVAHVPATKEDDAFGDDDDDLFADDGGEAAKALQEKLFKEAQERGKQKLKNARSLIVLEVKPYEADFDLEQLAQGIKTIEHEGIQNWGAEHKLVPIAYGIKKLVVSLVVYDELIMVDDIIDLINEKYPEDVQSIDVQAMSKV